MAYEVFALRYRPQSFADIVGQDVVTRTLQQAVLTDRVAHAFLFCGSRGVGKTSMARILSKALNCPQASEAEPCNKCDTCAAIGRGEDIDVVEIDGASNRGIDDVRAIKENVGYTPSVSRMKIFIIDEVHMLTMPAFNALLKVLEEPPAHVKFIFATTDVHALPETIVSRCQRYEFSRVSVSDIVNRLRQICGKEKVNADDSVLEAIAHKAEGGLRDSVSLLDQVISFCGTDISLQDLETALGMLPQEKMEQLLRALAAGDLAEVHGGIDGAFRAGHDPQEILAQLTGLLREFMVWHASPDHVARDGDRKLFEELAATMSLDRVMYALKILVNTRGAIRRSGHDRIQIELACLKVARTGDMLPIEHILDRLGKPTQEPPQGPDKRTGGPVSRPAGGPKETPAANPVQSDATTPATPTGEDVTPELGSIKAGWEGIVKAVHRISPVLSSSLTDVVPVKLEGRNLSLEVPADNNFIMQQLSQARSCKVLAGAVKEELGMEVSVRVVMESPTMDTATESKKDVYGDPAVRKFIEHFDGGIVDVENEDA